MNAAPSPPGGAEPDARGTRKVFRQMRDPIEVYNQYLIPQVIENTSRGERGFDIYSRLLRERIDNRACTKHFLVRRCQCRMDDVHLRWMNSHHAGKSIAYRRTRKSCQAIGVTNIRIKRLNRRNICRVGTEQGQGTYHDVR